MNINIKIVYVRGGKCENIKENMLGSVMCGGGSVYGVFAGGGERKAGALSAGDFVPADTVAVSDIIEGLTARSAVVTEMTTGRVLLKKSHRSSVSAVTMRSSWCFCSQQKR